MIKINLLPHRLHKREQIKKAFYVVQGLIFFVALAFILLVGAVISNMIASQERRNETIRQENQHLDMQIKEIAGLQQEIDALKARQQAVENLQSDRNQPVYLLSELVKQVPDGIYLKSLKQQDQKVVLNGYAQSNERVSELLRNVGNASPWLQKPELVEIKAATIDPSKKGQRVFDFTVNVDIKRSAAAKE